MLFADAEARVIGAAHAGWKGAFTGVLENTIAAMEGLGASARRHRRRARPLDQRRDNYEVGPEFVDRFVDADAGQRALLRALGKARPRDVRPATRYTVDRLRAAGVTADSLGRCTYAEEDLFFSYRRTTHRSEPDYGRQISAIVLEEI